MKESPGRRIGPVIAAVLIGVIAISAAFYFRPYRSTSPAVLLATDASVIVERSGLGLVFRPASGESRAGLAFYPGARVPPEAYAYLGQDLARAGYTAVILALPLGFAVFSPSRAVAAFKALPGVSSWIVGGHSLGGAMAASFCAAGGHDAADGREKVKGLLLLAAYPGGGADLSGSGIKVLSISASNDGLATPAKLQSARRLLPLGTRRVELAGGNHAQFGEYGLQPGDGAATMSAELEHGAVVEETLAFMGSILADLR